MRSLKVCGDSAALGESDFAALFRLSNHMANLTSMQPNNDFYLIGRLPECKPVAPA